MAKFVRDLVINQPDDFVHVIMNDYLQKNQFIMEGWKGEPGAVVRDASAAGADATGDAKSTADTGIYTGKILCIVGLVLAIVLWIVNIAILYISEQRHLA